MAKYPAELADALRGVVEGEVRFDQYSKILYSTDASVWQIEPIGAVVPKNSGDVVETMKLAARHRVPVLPRGGATSLSGQTVGEAIHIDFAKYMNRVLEFNEEEHWVRIQPGVVQDQLSRFLKPHGFQFGPATSSASRATLGGMIGNNSAGSHSILWGKTMDHVLELKVVLADGSEAWFRPVENGMLDTLTRGDGLEAKLYRDSLALGAKYQEKVLEKFPRILRRVSGYNLDELVARDGVFGAGYSSRPGPLNLARVVIGSEGTLGVVVEAKLNVVPLPKHKSILLVHFKSLFDAVDSTETIVETKPAAAELIDEFILSSARRLDDFREKIKFVDPAAEALMVVEYYGDSEAEVASKVANLKRILEAKRMGFGYVEVNDAARQAAIWQTRKEALGIMMSVKGDHKPIAFVEDPAVPLNEMPRFLRGFREILGKHDAHGGYYGHASVGCLHVRPMVNLKNAEGVNKMAAIADEVFQLVMRHHGSMSGEHGDGIARSKYNKWLFGDEVYQGFLELKKLWDPDNILNPGKVVNAPELTENLRWGADYKMVQIQTHLDFSREGGFDRAIEMCNGAGVCRKRMVGTMCPSYHATMEEEHSTRGRANLLRAALSGKLPHEEFTSKRMYEALDLCLECKGCKRECPSNVDLAKIKYEFLAHYYEKNGTPLRARFFSNAERLNKVGSAFAPLSNWMLGLAPMRKLNEAILGVDARRELPPFASQTFSQWFRKRSGGPGTPPVGRVALFADCFLEWNYPQVGRAAVELLEAAGFEVVLAEKTCCGRPSISKGFLEDAREKAERNVRSLEKYADQGVPVVGCEPSCLLTLRDEYLDLVKGDAVAKVAANAFMLDEFLVARSKQGKLALSLNGGPRKVLLHGHCHQKSHIGTAPTIAALKLIPDCDVSEVNSGCCGMAGSFGFEKEHYDLSEKIGRERLFPAVEAADKDTEIAITGVSCRQQIGHFTHRQPRHAIEILRDAVR
jgi:anaerobic glycerol-3-phosphate dehydrogenase C subunit